MSNYLKKMILGMSAGVDSSRNRRTLLEARQRNAGLACYGTVQDMLALFGDETRETTKQRDRLTRVLIAEHRLRKSSFWSTVLFIAYYPMLVSLRFRLRSVPHTSDELDQLVMSTFLEVLESAPVDGVTRMSLHLRRQTARELFRTIRWESVPEDSFGDFDRTPSTAGLSDCFGNEQAVQFVFGDLYRQVSSEVDELALRAILATVLGGEESQSLARHLTRDEPATEKRFHELLKRRKTRALRLLEQILSPRDALFDRSVP